MSSRLREMAAALMAADLGLPSVADIHIVTKSSGASYDYWSRIAHADKPVFHSDLLTAYNALTDDRNDVILLGPNYDSNMTAAIVWANNATHLIGAAPTPNQPRNDIWQSGTFSPMFTVSGRGNVFANFTIRHGTTAGDLIGMLISGRYNYFNNVYFYTPNVAAQDLADYIGVSITGHNNYFRGCHFGSEGTARDQANTNVKIAGSGHVFEDCFFSMMADGVAPTFLHIDTADDRRYILFKNCTFFCHWVNKGDQITYALKITGANATTNVIFDSRCTFVGVDYICDTTDDQHVWIPVVPADETITAGLISLTGQGT